MYKRLLFCFLLLAPVMLRAQDMFSIGLDAAFPTGNLSNIAGTGFGGTLRFEHPLSRNMTSTLTAGYTLFASKDVNSPLVGTTTYKVSMIPVQMGLKFYLGDQGDRPKGWFVGGEIGFNFLTTKTTFFGSDVTGSSNFFCYSPSLGYLMDNLEFSARFLSNTGSDPEAFYGLRIAYILK